MFAQIGNYDGVGGRRRRYSSSYFAVVITWLRGKGFLPSRKQQNSEGWPSLKGSNVRCSSKLQRTAAATQQHTNKQPTVPVDDNDANL